MNFGPEAGDYESRLFRNLASLGHPGQPLAEVHCVVLLAPVLFPRPPIPQTPRAHGIV
jgi:hypothetical protein